MQAAETINATAVGSGVNGPTTAQLGLNVNILKDNFFNGPAAVGEVDGIGIFVRQNGPGSDSSGLLINVQNEGHGFLSATEFVSTIVDLTTNTETYGVDVQEGVLDVAAGDFIGAVYNADTGTLGTAILVQDNPDAGAWSYVIENVQNGGVNFSVDSSGNLVANTVSVGGATLNGDPINGSVDVGNLGNMAATPYISFDGLGVAGNATLINDAPGELSINTTTPGSLRVNASGVYSSGSFHLNLQTPASSSAPCTAGQLGADASYVYVCTATNTWKRSALTAF